MAASSACTFSQQNLLPFLLEVLSQRLLGFIPLTSFLSNRYLCPSKARTNLSELTRRFKFEIIFCSLLSALHFRQDELHLAREKITLGSILISKFVWSMFVFFRIRHFSVTAWTSHGALQTSLDISRRRSRLMFDAIFALVLHCLTWILSLIFLVIDSTLVKSTQNY
jgi:hypothetical protein